MYTRLINKLYTLKLTFLIHLSLLLGMFFSSSLVIDQSQKQKVDEILKIWDSKDKPGIAVAVNQGSKTVYKRSFGLADLESQSLIKNETTFLIASVSKQFTAFAINLLAAEGKLNLSDDVRKHIPDLPDYGHKITITHLLNHTSGLRDMDDLNGIIGVGLSDYNTFNDSFKLIKNQKQLNFIPGSEFDYSNSAYILLAKVVENITELSFREFMDTRVFKPLKMNHTFVMDNPFEVIENKATAYFSSDGTAHSRNNLFSANYGSTGMYATIDDLNLWAKNFIDPKVGNQAIFNTMKTQGVLNDGEVISYAMGQEIKQVQGYEAVFHGGGQGAYRAYLIRFPEVELSITLLSNSSYSTSFILEYVDAIAAIYLPKKPKEDSTTKQHEKSMDANLTEFPKNQNAVEVDTPTLNKFVGNYKIQDGLIFTIEKVENGIHLVMTGNETPIELKPIANNEFILLDSNNGYRIIFKDFKSGPSSAISYYQHDFEYKAKRIEMVEFDVTAIDWEELTGVFYSPELKTAYSIVYDGNNLIAEHARNLPIKLNPFQPDVFNSSSTFFQKVEFIRNDNNEITEILVSGSRSKDMLFIKVESIHSIQ